MPKAYLGAIQISIMEFIAQKVPVFGVILVRIQFECENNSEYGLFSSSAYCENSFKKISIIDVWQFSEFVSKWVMGLLVNLWNYFEENQ